MFAIYSLLRPFCLLQAVTNQLPPPNLHLAHQPLLQLRYDYAHYYSPTVLRGPSWSDTSSWVKYQGTHQSSAHPSSRSGGIVNCPMCSISCRHCRCCLVIFLWTPHRLARWSCLLLLVASWTPSSCWLGQLDLLCSWGTGISRAYRYWKSYTSDPKNSHSSPPQYHAYKVLLLCHFRSRLKIIW